jgi:uncharacterized OsmC-like protein
VTTVDEDVGDVGQGPRQRILRCRTVSMGALQHLSYVRNLPPVKVEERLGPPTDGEAMTPSETLLAALGSCLAARIHAGAVTGSIAVQSLELEIEVDVEKSPFWGNPGEEARSVGFESIRVTVHFEADAPADALRALIAHALMWSPVANTLHGPVHLDMTLGRTSAEPGG